MRRFLFVTVLLGFSSGTTAQDGYVISASEGERTLRGDVLIKVSPTTGSQSMEVFAQTSDAGRSTLIHRHTEADEVFYVVSGKGDVLLGGERHPFQEGDVIFIPKNVRHQVSAHDEVRTIFVTDRPGVAENFRKAHQILLDTGSMPTVQETHEFAIPLGTVFEE